MFYEQSKGSLIIRDNKIVGSYLLGQNFSDNKYFWGRPSANHYNTLMSAGTNLSPANPALLVNVNNRVKQLKDADPDNKAKIPMDLVTASGSGLDPHISLLAAEYQITRIAKVRGLAEDVVQSIITDNIELQSEMFGSPYVNVLKLNLALDNLK